MGIEEAQKRLAAHGQEAPDALPEPDLDDDLPDDVEVPEKPPTVRDLLRMTNSRSAATVIGLKSMGVLVDHGDHMLYTLAEPPTGRGVPPGLKIFRLTKVIKGRHRRQMLAHGEPDEDGRLIPLRHVLLSWVSALSNQPMSIIDELGKDDCDALMCVAQWIETAPGN